MAALQINAYMAGMGFIIDKPSRAAHATPRAYFMNPSLFFASPKVNV
jgi:hypothetical protein